MIQVRDQRMRVAGSEDGRTVLMMHQWIAGYFSVDFKRRQEHSKTVNANYDAIRKIIEDSNLQLRSLTRVGKSNIIEGYIIETNENLYSRLLPLTIE